MSINRSTLSTHAPKFLPHVACHAPKNLRRKLSWHCTNLRNSRKFSPLKVSRYTVLCIGLWPHSFMYLYIWYLLRAVTPLSQNISAILTYTTYVLFLIHSCLDIIDYSLISPRSACAGKVTVVISSVCLSVYYHEICCIPCLYVENKMS